MFQVVILEMSDDDNHSENDSLFETFDHPLPVNILMYFYYLEISNFDDFFFQLLDMYGKLKNENSD